MSTTTELPPVPQLVRKSAYGRTALFLPTRGAMLREVKCMGGVERHDRANVYHVLEDTYNSQKEVACWHCCDMIPSDGPRIPLPRIYDTADKTYHVYGSTCCAGCAKAYVLEHTSFDRGQHLSVLMKMLREVYGIRGDVCEMPPRPALQRFGGMFDPRRIRAADAERTRSYRMIEPPFVSYCMIVEEHLGEEAARAGLRTDWAKGDTVAPLSQPSSQPPPPSQEAITAQDVEMLEEPLPPGLYTAYMQTRQGASAQTEGSSSHAEAAPKRGREAPPPHQPSDKRTGPMTRFYQGQTTHASE